MNLVRYGEWLLPDVKEHTYTLETIHLDQLDISSI